MPKPLALTLSKLRLSSNIQNTDFLRIYSWLLGDESQETSVEDKLFILRIAVTFIESSDSYVSQLGYRLVLIYADKYSEYESLYDVALLLGYMPIVHFIENNFSDSINGDTPQFSKYFLSAYKNTFVQGQDNQIIRTSGQMLLYDFAMKNVNTTIVAPTSYGKSELMIKKVKANIGKSICVVVPSKALLSQTKRLLAKDEAIASSYSKIITHPDMYHGETNIVAALTQERLLRLLKMHPELKFDVVLLDEAHNLLNNDSRSVLIAQVLLLCFKRNGETDFSFYTPFIADTNNVELITSPAGENGKQITEHMKVEKYYYTNPGESRLYYYDQYLNKTLFSTPLQSTSPLRTVNEKSGNKNLVYVNRPIRVEEFANKLAASLPNTEPDSYQDEVIRAIAQLIHRDYSLIDCIKKGVLFHHGGLPDVIRLFVENYFNKEESAKYLVCTSTLLEGVNIPAEKIFILTPQKYPGYLSNSEFKNLIGRVCRFSEIFNEQTGSLKLLQPEVYLLSTDYSPSNFKAEPYLKEHASINIEAEDKVLNPLLKNTTNIADREAELQYLENIEPGSTDLVSPRLAETEIGKSCFVNGIKDFNIIENEQVILEAFSRYFESHEVVSSPSQLIEAIYEIFLKNVTLNEDLRNLSRIRNSEIARNFYAMFIDWRASGAPYGLMVSSFLRYWSELDNKTVYIGSKWGELKMGGWRKLWVNLARKTQPQLVNLAIAKIKEEQDFVDHNLMQYTETLHDMGKIEDGFYDKFKYGTDDKNKIVLLKSGMSLELTNLLLGVYSQLVSIDSESEEVLLHSSLIDLMRENSENIILIFEAQSHVH